MELSAPLRLFAESDRDNNSITKAYTGSRDLRIDLFHVEGKVPRDPTTTKPWAMASCPQHGNYTKFVGEIGEDPIICFKKAVLYALKMHQGSMKGDGEESKMVWQEKVLPAIAQVEVELAELLD